ncbi:Rab GTPase [Tieghemostelium lacteum]|uniref:Rab GTPase n=1 Tax=Tieghemostelium lacteum TaxID=361077 RepID=A0A151ZSP6_TIELA|nr:Rab GTPase [Tieghemostelium lacteum]|eukprot:KYQ96959.1 Rab GTPase [Tieghemostelium lacteum]
MDTPTPIPVSTEKMHKLIFFGASGSGKTALINRMIFDKYRNDYVSIPTIDLYTKTLYHQTDMIKLNIFDTPGVGAMSVGDTFWKQTEGIVLVYDIKNRETFEKLGYWLNFFKTHSQGAKVPVMVLGNKLDLDSNLDGGGRQVSREEAEEWCKLNNIHIFFEVSAKDAVNTKECFTKFMDAFVSGIHQDLHHDDDDDDSSTLLKKNNTNSDDDAPSKGVFSCFCCM